MKKYQTMTVGGLYGSTYQASDAEEAATMAEADGYQVIDLYEERDGSVLLVVAG